ncbi:MAG: TIGR02757 family protein [Vicinamibacterales bacterium]
MRVRALRRAALKPPLDRLYESFNAPESATDPIQIVRRFSRPDDLEIVAFCAAALAFGRVASVLQSIERVLAVLGDRPAQFVGQFDPARDGRPLRDFAHRWTRGSDVIALLWILRQMLERSGSVESFFVEGDPGGDDVANALDAFSARALALDVARAYGRTPTRAGVGYFFPRPSAGSGCKRLNLFLRWMVRRDALDMGVWTRVAPSRLIVPLDTHVIRVARCLHLTRYSTPGWRMAAEITQSLRMLDPADPVKYDFSICHLGMMNACGFGTPRGDADCPLRGICRPRQRRARAASAR